MPIIAILLAAALIATFGFWDTLTGILGAVGVFILLAVIVVALAVAGVASWAKRANKSIRRQ
jgi:hypothetical protein